MSDVAKILIPAFLALIISFFTYHYQFRRNNKFVFLNRVRHLLHRVKEAQRIVRAECANVDKLITEIEGNPLKMHLLSTTGYPAVKYLHDKITHEDYFIAFTYIFRNAINGEKQFEGLQYAAVLLNTQLDSIKEMAINSLKADHERQKRFLDLWHDSLSFMTTFSREQSLRNEDEVPQEDKQYFQELTLAANEYFGRLQSGEITPEIKTIQQYFIQPVRHFFKQPIILKDLIAYSAQLDDINYIYNDILHQNTLIHDKLKEDNEKMKVTISKLSDSIEYLDNVQIKSLYN